MTIYVLYCTTTNEELSTDANGMAHRLRNGDLLGNPLARYVLLLVVLTSNELLQRAATNESDK